MSIKTNRYGTIKSDMVVIGIDVAKRRHVAAVRLPDGEISGPFGFQNNRGGRSFLATTTSPMRSTTSTAHSDAGWESS